MSMLARLLELESPPVSPEMQDATFHAALAAERTRVLRRRLQWYCGFGAAMLALSLLWNIATLYFKLDKTAAERAGTRLDTASDFVLAAVFVGAAVIIRKSKPDHEGLVTILRRLWLLAGGIALLTQPLANYLNMNPGSGGSEDTSAMLIGLSALAAVFLLHFVGALIIPLTWREATTPVLLLWITFAVVAMILYPGHWAVRVLLVMLFPLVGVPGVFWSYRSYTLLGERFHTRVLGERYGELKSELAYARRIHESLFPPPLETGPCEVRYWYDPMREIGGDFLYIHAPAADVAAGVPGPITVVLIDVSGHGVPAALAVNRLHGEIQRFFAERPEATPGALIADLNAYAHAALSGQAMYATAIAVRVASRADGTALISWSNAGHPPGIVRTAGGGWGEADELGGTCTMLGVLPPELFDAEERSRRASVAPGDRIVLFTDGAMDTRDADGAMLTLPELHRSLLPNRAGGEDPLEGAKRRILQHRGKAALADDCLVVQLTLRVPDSQVERALVHSQAV
jgi:serine phosphatase RsbU (regulator of sigma subunit)